MSAVSAVDGIEFLVIEHVSQAKNISMGVVRVTADGNMHPIDLVSALCKRNRDKSAETLRNVVKSGRLSKSEFVCVNNAKLIPFKSAMKLVMLLDGPDAKENRNRIATLLKYNIAGDDRVIPVLKQNAIQEALLNKAARDSILAEAASESPGMYNTRLCTELQQPIVGLEQPIVGLESIRIFKI